MTLGTNLRRMQRDLMVELLVGADIEKPQISAPFAYIQQGPGPWTYASGDTVAANVAADQGTGGQPLVCAQRRYSLPIKIGNDRVMHLSVFSDRGPVEGLTQDIRLRFYLDGVKRRPLG